MTYGFGARRRRCAPSTSRTTAAACASRARATARAARPRRSTLNLPGRAQRAERARGDRGRDASSACPTRRSRKALRRVPGRRPALPALRRQSRCAGGGSVHADRRLRPPPGRDGGDARRGARRLPGPAPGARVPAASLHAHARPVRGLRQVLSTADALLLAEVYAAGEAPIVAADGRSLARARARRRQGRAGVRRDDRRRCRDAIRRRRARRRRRHHHGRRARSATLPRS